MAMTYVESATLDSLVDAPQALRDRVATALIDLVWRALFVFGVQPITPVLAADFRTPGRLGLKGGADSKRDALLRIGYFGATTAPHHPARIQFMFDDAMTPMRQETPFEFGSSDLLERPRRSTFREGA
jgi:hypothetical protein